MLRPFVLKTDTTLKSLASTVLDGRVKGAQADAALAQLTAANPHVDPHKIEAGTVVLVPDTPGFKAAAASSIQSQPFADFQKTVSTALDAAAAAMRTGNAARAAERHAVATVLKSATFRRLVANTPDLQKAAEAALKAAEQDAAADKQAEAQLGTLNKAALATLADLAKIVG